jgi:hypothetical protein
MIKDAFTIYNDVKYINRAEDQRQLTALLNGGTFNYVKISFDPAKRRAALDDRGLDFVDAAIVFDGLTLTVQDMRRDYGAFPDCRISWRANGDGRLDATRRSTARHIHEKMQ